MIFQHQNELVGDAPADAILEAIAAVGADVRVLKAKGVNENEVAEKVAILLALKASYREATSQDSPWSHSSGQGKTTPTKNKINKKTKNQRAASSDASTTTPLEAPSAVNQTAMDSLLAKSGAALKGYHPPHRKEAILRWNGFMFGAFRNGDRSKIGDHSPSAFSSLPKCQSTPLVNRGYHCRAAAVEAVVRRWIRVHSSTAKAVGVKRQVVVIGAGFDTLLLRLLEEEDEEEQRQQFEQKLPRVPSPSSSSASSSSLSSSPRTVFFEVDAAAVVEAKLRALERGGGEAKTREAARTLLFGDDGDDGDGGSGEGGNGHGSKSGLVSSSGGGSSGGGSSGSKRRQQSLYRGAYFRTAAVDLLVDGSLRSTLKDTLGLQANVPTLVVVECVRSYLPPDAAARLLRDIAVLGNDDGEEEEEEEKVEADEEKEGSGGGGGGGVGGGKGSSLTTPDTTANTVEGSVPSMTTLVLYDPKPFEKHRHNRHGAGGGYRQALHEQFARRDCPLLASSPHHSSSSSSSSSDTGGSDRSGNGAGGGDTATATAAATTTRTRIRCAPSSLKAQLACAGWGCVEVVDMNEASLRYVEQPSTKRQQKQGDDGGDGEVEPFDEHAALHSFQRAYAFAVAVAAHAPALTRPNALATIAPVSRAASTTTGDDAALAQLPPTLPPPPSSWSSSLSTPLPPASTSPVLSVLARNLVSELTRRRHHDDDYYDNDGGGDRGPTRRATEKEGDLASSTNDKSASSSSSSSNNARSSGSTGSVGSGDRNVVIELLSAETVAGAVELVRSSHAAAAKEFPAVRRFWKNAMKKDLSDPLAFYNKGYGTNANATSSPGTDNVCMGFDGSGCGDGGDDDNADDEYDDDTKGHTIEPTPFRLFWVAVETSFDRRKQVVGCVALCENDDCDNEDVASSLLTKDRSSSFSSDQQDASAAVRCRRVELRRLAVAAQHQRQGTGEALVRTAIDFCRRHSTGTSSSDTASSKATTAAAAVATTLEAQPAAALSTASLGIRLCLTCLDGNRVPSALPACRLYTRLGFHLKARNVACNPPSTSDRALTPSPRSLAVEAESKHPAPVLPTPSSWPSPPSPSSSSSVPMCEYEILFV